MPSPGQLILQSTYPLPSETSNIGSQGLIATPEKVKMVFDKSPGVGIQLGSQACRDQNDQTWRDHVPTRAARDGDNMQDYHKV